MPGYQITSAVLTGVCGILVTITFVLHIISFSTWDWLVSDGYSPFVKIGFFEGCFDECKRPYCPGATDELILDGCYSLWESFQYDKYVQEIWYWLTPEWFLDCRILVVINIPFIGVCGFVLLVGALVAWRDCTSSETLKRRRVLVHILQLTGAGLCLLTALLAISAVCIFYTNAFRRDWMPMEYKNALGYSFWLEVTCAVLLTVCTFLMMLAAFFKTQKSPYEGLEYADDMHSTTTR